MRVLHIQKYGRTPVLTTCPLPQRGPGEYLIKMKYAPINPSDLNFYTGLYGIRKQHFPIMGFQGSGVIEQCDQKQLIGSRVTVLANMKNGTYAQYLVSNESEIIVWPSSVGLSDQQLSMFAINPLSVLGLSSIVQEQKASQVVLSAASSNVSKMVVRLLARKWPSILIYGLSRSDNLDAELKALGYHSLFRMEEAPKLKEALRQDQNAVFLDCVGGNFAGNIFNVLPIGSTMVNYGRLSKENLGNIDLAQLYFREKHIRGFWLNTYLKSIAEPELRAAKRDIIDQHALFTQRIRGTYPLEKFVEASREAIQRQSEGKILLELY